MSICIFIPVSMFISISTSTSISMSISVSIPISTSLCLSRSLFVSVSVSLSASVSISISVSHFLQFCLGCFGFLHCMGAARVCRVVISGFKGGPRRLSIRVRQSFARAVIRTL